MVNRIPIVTYEELLNALSYEPDTGIFRWKQWINGRPPIGTVAGCRMRIGYITISIRQRRYYAHQLAWLYMTGEWPKRFLDHKNNNPSDNRWCNLREANDAQNARNSRKRQTNTIGYKGVILDKRTSRYGARVSLNGKYFYFGWFDDPYEAHLAYAAGIKILHGEFARSE